MNPTKPDVLDWFDLKVSPFGEFRTGKEFFESSEYRTAVRMISYAVDGYEMIAMVGDVGSGKTEAVRAAVNTVAGAEGAQVEFIRITHPEKETMRIAAVLEAALHHFMQDAPKLPHSQQRRQWLMRHHLTMAHQQGRRTCLIIDEAQRISGKFLKSLKELHETMRFGPYASLFGTVLIGHHKLVTHYQKVARDVWNRLDAGNIAYFGQYTPPEVSAYIEHRCNHAKAPSLFSETARLKVGRIATSPLEINRVCWKLIEAAYLAGEKEVSENLVLSAFDRAELAARLGLSELDIAKALGIGKTTVSDAYHGRASKATTEAVDGLLRETMETAG